MVAIIDYEAGNLTSVRRAFEYLGIPAKITRDKQEIKKAERVVFPGVGQAGAAMESLKKYSLDIVLKEVIQAETPVLGICLGCQIILDFSQENQTPCLKIMPGRVYRLALSSINRELKIPHMGWNTLVAQQSHSLLKNIDPEERFYFVHEYYPKPDNKNNIIALTEYGLEFPSFIANKNLAAMQFHPEKSGRPGLQILQNFASWAGKD